MQQKFSETYSTSSLIIWFCILSL